jgi:cyclophilin family peptidyl-prolyl cis-trans isomerase
MPNPVATIETTNGNMTFELYLDRVPITASNFIGKCQCIGTYEDRWCGVRGRLFLDR